MSKIYMSALKCDFLLNNDEVVFDTFGVVFQRKWKSFLDAIISVKTRVHRESCT